MSMIRLFIVLPFLLLAAGATMGQQADTLAAYNAEELFAKGRVASFAGDTEKGRLYLSKALEQSPDYTDIEVFLARTHLWDNEPEKAARAIAALLAKSPDNLDAMGVMTDAAFQQSDWETALQWIDKGLKKNGTDKALLIKKVQALQALERFDEGADVLDVLLQRFPGDKELLDLQAGLNSQRKVNSVMASANYDFFSEVFGNAATYSLQYGRKTSLGTVFGRVNQSNRFDTQGWQAEVDLYPTIARGVYAYLNYGYSPTALFPAHRAGGEIYASLPLAFEASGGFRYLYFNASSDVLMYTASLGKYYKNLWFSARVFVTPTASLTTTSLALQARRYFADPNHFIGLSGGFGFSPDFRNLQSNDGLSTTEIYRLKSDRVALTYQKPIGQSWQLAGDIGYGRQELVFDAGNYVQIWSVNVRARYSF